MYLRKNFRFISLTGSKHVECPERIWSIYLHLEKKGLIENMKKIDGDLIDESVLKLCHGEAYLMKIDSKVGIDNEDPFNPKPIKKNANTYSFHSDTYENKWTQYCAKLSAGSVISLMNALYTYSIKSGFCIVRPPGHHAHQNAASGFCFYNNVALAARYIQKNHGVQKICIFDWDIHFGDGTSAIFEADPSVLYISPHRYDGGKFYPGGGAGSAKKIGEKAGKGFNINIPFDVSGMGNDEYIYVCENLIFPIIQEFNPEIIIISAGFDSAEGDPLGGFKLTPACYAYMTQRLLDICHKVVAVLEGGYNTETIAHCSEAVVRVLQGQRLPIEEINAFESAESMHMNIRPHKEAQNVISRVSKHISKYWHCVEHFISRMRKTTEEDMNINLNFNAEGLDELVLNRKTTL